MEFGIYVHHAGSTWLNQVSATLSAFVRPELRAEMSTEVDGLYIGLLASSALPDGQQTLKKRVRRDCTLKDAVGSRHFFRCLVEFDAAVADADLVAHATHEEDLFEFTKTVIVRCLPDALRGFKYEQTIVQAAVSRASLPHPPRW